MEKNIQKNKLKALFFGALFAAMLIWGVSYLVMKDTLDAVSPGFLIFVRSVIAVAFLVFFCIGKLKGISKRFWLFNICTGLILASAYIIQTVGLQYTTPGKNAFLENVYCIVIPLLMWAIKKKRPTIPNWISILFCVGGVVLISLDSINGEFNVGDLLSTLAGVLYGVNSVLTGIYANGKNPIPYTTCQFSVMTVVSLIYTLIFERSTDGTINFYSLFVEGKWEAITIEVILKLLFLGIMVTAVAWLLKNVAQQNLAPITCGVILPFSAVVGTIISACFGADKITLSFVFGGLLLTAAILLDTLLDEFKNRRNKMINKKEKELIK